MTSHQKTKPRTSTLRLAFITLAATALPSLASADVRVQISDPITSGQEQNVFARNTRNFTGSDFTRLVFNNASSAGNASLLQHQIPGDLAR
ncbi:hypothetical protein OpiT1DRAFT_02859 [Opitutaceae bacterium TAV1]|nr:hypothetical protein OpiT1DRAFT_02859 [Opitutaceae bacterium TAV1]